MSWHNKVVWNEGLFLRPQLFQQQERYLESYAHKRCVPLNPFYWGFSHHLIERDALALGKLVMAEASGVFADGAPFDAPGQSAPPPPLTLQPQHLQQTIYLATPLRTPHAEETAFVDSAAALARYLAVEQELRDTNAIGQAPQTVQLAQLRLRLLPENEMTDAWIGLPIARVGAVRSDGSAELDPDFIAPVSAIGASLLLSNWLKKIQGLTQLRAQNLAQRLCGADGKNADANEVSDFLLLQMLNRYEALLNHQLHVGETTPEAMYTLLISLAGELSTYVRTSTRRPGSYASYQHGDPYLTFKTLVDDVHALLNEVLVRSAQRIEVQARAHGLHLAVMEPTMLRGFASLVLAVAADMPVDVLVSRFAAHGKLAPSERLPDLVRSHLPGIGITALPVAPRQIPFNAGFVYYELQRQGPLWDQLIQHGGLAMHVSGEFPGLRIELWGVREK
jgi:type VI secretion system protein ImpJ